jgi:hypothetical protein
MLISTVAFGFGAPGLQAANFLTLFGALDRLGGFFVLASIREFAPWVDSMIVAGVAGPSKLRDGINRVSVKFRGQLRTQQQVCLRSDLLKAQFCWDFVGGAPARRQNFGGRDPNF